MKSNTLLSFGLFAGLAATLTACDKDDDKMPVQRTITVENVLDGRPLVQSGAFQHAGASPVTMPGESLSFQFYAGKGQALTFATMYGWSNDLFFAPENPGIKVYDDAGMPIEGDVSAQVKLWDNGTRINQQPGANVVHPGTAESAAGNITEVNGMDAQGNSYAGAASLMKVSLHYEGNSRFTLTITNTSGQTANPTPFSPGVWAVSYIAGGNLLDAAPLYKKGMPAVNGITNIAEAGDNAMLNTYLQGRTGIFTPLSPILVVVYKGIDNPVYKAGQADAGHGLAKLAQTGDASTLAAYLQTLPGVKKVYTLAAEGTTVLLPAIGGQAGGKVTQALETQAGDKIAIATMYGFSTDWFFATKGEIDATQTGDLSSQVALFDNGTALDQYPGAGLNQVNLGGVIVPENKPIAEIPNPNAYTTLPAINQLIKVVIQ